MQEHPNRIRLEPGNELWKLALIAKSNGKIKDVEEFVGISRNWWIFNKAKLGDVCNRCGYDKFEILQVHHKDRNVGNNVAENLELVCPNCHLLEHYESGDGLFWNRKK